MKKTIKDNSIDTFDNTIEILMGFGFKEDFDKMLKEATDDDNLSYEEVKLKNERNIWYSNYNKPKNNK